LFDVLQNFVGAGSSELRTEGEMGRGMPDGLNLGREFETGFLFAGLFHLSVDLNYHSACADTITARKQGNSCDWAWHQ
jgi:hypothetical protein